MVLLLSGGTEMARGVIVDKFLADHPDWRHLALEDLDATQDPDDVIGMGPFFALLVACECAKDALKEGFNVVITCPKAEMLETVQESFPQEMLSVHLSRGARKVKGDYDQIIDTARRSVTDTCALLSELIAQ